MTLDPTSPNPQTTEVNQFHETITIPLRAKHRATAEQFAKAATHPDQRDVIYHNTLAILALSDWLHWLQIPHSHQNCESWDPVIRGFDDVADLAIEEVGRVECRPVFPGADSLEIALESQADRVGYFAIGLDLQTGDRPEATLIGFIPTSALFDREQIWLSELQSLDDFLEWWDAKVAETRAVNSETSQQRVSTSNPVVSSEIDSKINPEINPAINPRTNPEPDPELYPEVQPTGAKPAVSMIPWLENQFEHGWQSLSSLLQEILEPDSFRVGYRKQPKITGAKLLVIKNLEKPILLSVDIGHHELTEEEASSPENLPESLRLWDITIQLRNLDVEMLLPNELQLTLLDHLGQAVEQATPEIHTGLTIDLIANPGETFMAQVVLGDFKVIETLTAPSL
ncbi:DUF1822 family protein [Limnothrix sp. FACHB-1083]|uniref:DUF1822 family protein n=1 Tax=unclassified Limnothrix TaxID=2632864 RepID=UPI0016816046|nr:MULTISPECIES: DUF1822 family protein [unclassified Limnothrix]MBD2161836.1 DUF1822 family protein [Limnothrix sp. FACHB-1083]MBD2192587.1 DUF1822 family protein [Limnothrix sp. FACHB-1088]